MTAWNFNLKFGELFELRALCIFLFWLQSPEFFYSSISKTFRLEDNVFDVLEFADELDKLQG